MTPSKDPFEQHIQGLYKGHEVPSPTSAQDNVFKQLDDIRIKSYVNKALFATVVSVAAILWFYSPSELEVNSPVTAPEILPELIQDPPNSSSPAEDQLQQEVLLVPVIEAVVEVDEAVEVVEVDDLVDEAVEKITPADVPAVVPADVPADVQEVVVEEAKDGDVEESKEDEQSDDESKDESDEWILGGSIKVEK